MSSTLEKALSVLEFLVEHPLGCSVSDVASALNMPLSGAHRLLRDLEKIGYVSQIREMGDYRLTIKLASLGLSFLGQTGIGNISQPILDNLARDTQELVRLSLIDNDDLVWVGVAQGAVSGLRYDPGNEQGQVAHLASSAGGQAWLASLSDEEAIALVMKQGLIKPLAPGADAPDTVASLLSILQEVRQRGFSLNADSFMQGMAAMATAIKSPESGKVIGCVSIAGPSARLSPEIMITLWDKLQEASISLSEASRASQYFSNNFSSNDRNT